MSGKKRRIGSNHKVIHNRNQCNLCNKSFAFPSNLEDHMRAVHTGEKSLSCNFCDQTFSAKWHLYAHTKRHLGEAGKKHVCQICNKRFTEAFKLKRHMSTHESKDTKLYLCQICTKSFKTAEYSTTHFKRSHNGSKLCCNFCGDIFREKVSLYDHYRIHIGEYLHSCEICDSPQPSRLELSNHMKMHLNRTKNYHQCMFCWETFSSNPQLILNFKAQPCGKITFKCPDCPFKASSKRILLTHLETKGCGPAVKSEMGMYLNSKLPGVYHPCKMCKLVFIPESSLKVHFKIHTDERPFKCEICGKTWTTRTNLNSHKRCHKGDSEKNFQCHFCPKKCINKEDLYKHLISHTGERPFKCDICENRFTGSSSLKVHQRVHTGEKPYVCRECGRGFAIAGELRRHETKVVPHRKQCPRCSEVVTCGKPGYLKHLQNKHPDEIPKKKHHRHYCVFCEKGFDSFYACCVHIRSHIKELPFTCKICKKGFASRSYLRKHVEKEHTSGN